MSIKTTIGCKRAIAKTYSAAIVISAITNAAEAVASLPAGHAVVVGDFVEISSSWRDLNQKIARIKAVNANDVTLEGFDTSDVKDFPAGAGIGSLRRITAWDEFDNVKDVKTSGGEQQWLTQQIDGDKNERKIPGIRSATTVSLDVYDDPCMPWFKTAQAANKAGLPAAYRTSLASGAISVVSTYWGVSDTPDEGKNVEVTSKIDLAFITAPTRYAA